MHALTPSWRQAVPWGLVVSRLAAGPILVIAAAIWGTGWPLGAVVVLAFLSDWLDGVLARRWGTVTPALRQWDSRADVLFYLCVLTAAYCFVPKEIEPWRGPLLAIVAFEVMCQILSWWRFRQGTATHTWCCKTWAVVLMATGALVLSGQSIGWLLPTCIGLGYIAYAEVLVMLIVARRAPIDVRWLPTVLAANRLQRADHVCD